MIREATRADIPAMLEKAARFADTIKVTETVGYDPETVAGLLAGLIDNPMGFVLVGEGGGVGGLVHPSMFNAEHMTGSELFWWVDADQRGHGLRLFAAMEDAARARGAQSWVVSTMEALNFAGAGRFYERRGYQPCDRNYIKRF